MHDEVLELSCKAYIPTYGPVGGPRREQPAFICATRPGDINSWQVKLPTWPQFVQRCDLDERGSSSRKFCSAQLLWRPFILVTGIEREAITEREDGRDQVGTDKLTSGADYCGTERGVR